MNRRWDGYSTISVRPPIEAIKSPALIDHAQARYLVLFADLVDRDV